MEKLHPVNVQNDDPVMLQIWTPGQADSERMMQPDSADPAVGERSWTDEWSVAEVPQTQKFFVVGAQKLVSVTVDANSWSDRAWKISGLEPTTLRKSGKFHNHWTCTTLTNLLYQSQRTFTGLDQDSLGYNRYGTSIGWDAVLRISLNK